MAWQRNAHYGKTSKRLNHTPACAQAMPDNRVSLTLDDGRSFVIDAERLKPQADGTYLSRDSSPPTADCPLFVSLRSRERPAPLRVQVRSHCPLQYDVRKAADLDEAASGEGHVQRRVVQVGYPVEVAVRRPAAHGPGVQQPGPGLTVDRHERTGQPHRKAALNLIWVELHVAEDDAVVVTLSVVILAASDRNLPAAAELLLQARLDLPARPAVGRSQHMIDVEDVDLVCVVGVDEEASGCGGAGAGHQLLPGRHPLRPPPQPVRAVTADVEHRRGVPAGGLNGADVRVR